MIDQTLEFLKEQLNQQLKADFGVSAGDSEAEKDLVVFIDGEKMEPLSFPTGAVSVLLVNIEQEKTMRRAEPHRSVSADGAPQRINPQIRLDLSVLFVAHFKQYEIGLKTLSGIAQFYQEHPLFLHTEYPQLPSRIARLAVEPVSLPFAEQNEVWSALRTTYRPSLLYRMRMLVFSDRLPASLPPVSETEVAGLHKPPC